MKKAEALEQWQGLKPNQPILKHMKPLAARSEGSTFGACGIRIDGTPRFVEAVFSHLQELILGENTITRLQLSRNEVKPVEIGGERKNWDNAENNAEVCYIRLHWRGHEGMIAAAIFDKDAQARDAGYELAVGAK